jgi:hypothetical protein
MAVVDFVVCAVLRVRFVDASDNWTFGVWFHLDDLRSTIQQEKEKFLPQMKE